MISRTHRTYKKGPTMMMMRGRSGYIFDERTLSILPADMLLSSFKRFSITATLRTHERTSCIHHIIQLRFNPNARRMI